MLTKLLTLLTAVVTLSISLMLIVFVLTSRETQVKNRMEALKKQAYDIAYLASAQFDQRLDFFIGNQRTFVRQFMEQKLWAVYKEYGAYCLVVDRSGRVTGYFSSVIKHNQELSSQFDAQDIAHTLARVLQGEEIVLQTKGQAGPMFTIAVPWKQENVVVGAVYIQTAAQTVQQSYTGLWQQALMAALFAFLAAAAIAILFTRRLVNPLKKMSHSASLMAKGLPAPPVPEEGSTELRELATSFNLMSQQIQNTEKTRRMFIANLSHELRSPMTSIQGFLQGILDGTVQPQEQEQTLQIVLDETKRLSKLVNSLLRLSRAENDQEPLEQKPFNICELIRRVLITRLSPIEEKNIQVETLFSQDDMFALGVQDQIEQVLINLVDNAIRFAPQNGKLILSCREFDRKTLEVTVQDNGIGVLPEDEEHLFDRFYKGDQAHTAGEGVGLGLAISRAILENHHQCIWLKPDKPGASFAFTLQKAEKYDKHAD